MEIKTLNSIKVLWIQPRFTYTDHTNEDILGMFWVRLADSSFCLVSDPDEDECSSVLHWMGQSKRIYMYHRHFLCSCLFV